MDYPKRNAQSAYHFLQGKEVEIGLSKAGKRVAVVEGTAVALSEMAYETLRAHSTEGLQYFEFQVESGAWVPCICKAGGGLQNSVKLTF